jgi:hypothetical protein
MAKKPTLHEVEMFVQITGENAILLKGMYVTVTREAMGERHRLCRVADKGKLRMFHGVLMIPPADFTEVPNVDEVLLRERLFCGVFPTGWSWCDRSIEEHGDYVRVAYMSFATLELEISRPKSPLLPLIQKDAAELQARRGQEYQVSTAGQTVTLGKGQ